MMHIGFGYDSHRLVEGRKLILGGVEIPFEKGCEAHSDGDALIHAICDALLGAAGKDDIGSHFPDTDSAYKNIDSKILLKRVVSLIEDDGWQVGNLDTTILIERPKMKPYHDEIVRALADLLKISPEKVAVKAKTNEKMGFVGSGEGVAVYAVCTIVKNDNNL